MSSDKYIGEVVLLPTGNDILTLTRVIQDLQDKLQKTANELEEAKRDSERYYRWWQEDAVRRQNLEDEIKLRDEKEANRA